MRLCQHTHTHTILNAVILWPPHNPEAPPLPLQQTALSLKIFNSRTDQRVKKHSELLDPSPGLPSTFSFIHLLRRVWSGTHYVALAGLDLTMQIKMAPMCADPVCPTSHHVQHSLTWAIFPLPVSPGTDWGQSSQSIPLHLPPLPRLPKANSLPDEHLEAQLWQPPLNNEAQTHNPVGMGLNCVPTPKGLRVLGSQYLRRWPYLVEDPIVTQEHQIMVRSLGQWLIFIKGGIKTQGYALRWCCEEPQGEDGSLRKTKEGSPRIDPSLTPPHLWRKPPWCITPLGRLLAHVYGDTTLLSHLHTFC